MSVPQYEALFPANLFEEFYAELAYAKREAQRSGKAAELVDALPPDVLNSRLHTLLERQAQDARRMGGEYGEGLYRDAQYVMAALADDLFLRMDWEGREYWRKNLLEYRQFGTKVAGERVFEMADRLVAERDPAQGGMAAVLLDALSLGFRGRYSGDENEARLAAYRGELHAFLVRNGLANPGGEKSLFPEGYAAVFSPAETKDLPPFRRWGLAVLSLGLLMFLVSHLLWMKLTGPINAVIDQIIPG